MKTDREIWRFLEWMFSLPAATLKAVADCMQLPNARLGHPGCLHRKSKGEF